MTEGERTAPLRGAVMRAIENRHTIMAEESGDVDAMRLPYRELERRRSSELDAALDAYAAALRQEGRIAALREQHCEWVSLWPGGMQRHEDHLTDGGRPCSDSPQNEYKPCHRCRALSEAERGEAP